MQVDAAAQSSADVTAVMDAVWQNLLARESGAIAGSEMRELARGIAARAREARMRPEELIVQIKRSWWEQRDQLPDLVARRRLQTVLDEMISRCIEEFYGRQQ